MRYHHPPAHHAGATRTRRAFTLIEMLVVLILLAIVFSMAFPTMRAMTRETARSVGSNTVALAGTTARGYATRPGKDTAFKQDLWPTRPPDPDTYDYGTYSGVAAVFTPDGEIRMAENRPETLFVNGGNRWPLERSDRMGSMVPLGASQPAEHCNGFADLEGVDPITLPADTGVAGIIRDGAGGPPTLLAPPFAVWFTRSGSTVVTDTNSNNAASFAYYDANRDGRINVNNMTRPGSYNPDAFDRRQGGSTNFPFEQLESVVGVYVFSHSAMRQAGLWWDEAGASNADRWEWLKENGTLVVFGGQSGNALRDLTVRQQQ